VASKQRAASDSLAQIRWEEMKWNEKEQNLHSVSVSFCRPILALKFQTHTHTQAANKQWSVGHNWPSRSCSCCISGSTTKPLSVWNLR